MSRRIGGLGSTGPRIHRKTWNKVVRIDVKTDLHGDREEGEIDHNCFAELRNGRKPQ